MAGPHVIAIIDDDVSVRLAVESLLRSAGYAACTFRSAEDFLASPERDVSACLIVDIQMPGMTGIELLDHLMQGGSALPVIFITAFPESPLRRKAVAAGAIGFLSKPFDSNELLGHIQFALTPPSSPS